MFMQNHRDSSVLRSLALSFGEGLAFSVGAKLAQNATRPTRAAEASDFAAVASRLEQIEDRMQRIERPREPLQFDQKAVQAVVTVLETRLQEQSGYVDRRLEEQAVSLRADVKEMLREFTSVVARVVEDQVAERSAAMEAGFQERLVATVAPLQAELAELRERVTETETAMAEFVSAISLMCRKAAERKDGRAVVEPEAESIAGPGSEPEPEPSVAAGEPALDLPVPDFGQSRETPGGWRIRVASSFLFAFAAAGLLMRAF
jgi:hypothetical protein